MHGRSIRYSVTPVAGKGTRVVLNAMASRNSPGVEVAHTPAGRLSRRLSIASLCIAAIAALLIYQPYSARPFDMRDFSEFVPLLKGHDSVFKQFDKMTSYYATRGRANLIPYAAIVAKWKLFGWNSVWWQLLRFAQMCTVVVMAFAVIRRFGAGRAGAMLGASMFIVAGSAAHGWVRLTMAEVVGTQLLLLGLLIAFRVQGAPDWRWRVTVLGIIVAALVLAKEMFIATVPLLVAVAVCWNDDNTLGVPRFSRKNVAVCVTCGVAALATVIPLGLVAINAPAGAYTSTFGTEGFPWFRPVVWLTGAVTPYLVVSWRSPGWSLLQLLAFCALLVLGLRPLLHDPVRREHYRALLALLALHMLAGAVLYLPWPVYQPFYAMPFFIATATAIGLAATGVRKVPKSRAALGTFAALGWGFVLGSATIEAIDYRRATDAEQRFNADLVGLIAAKRPQVDSLVVANKKPLRGARAWQGWGATIARYGNALSYDLPVVRDDDCATARERRANSSATTLVLRNGKTCDPMGKPDTVLVRRFVQFDWDRLRPVEDSLFAELYRGGTGTGP